MYMLIFNINVFNDCLSSSEGRFSYTTLPYECFKICIRLTHGNVTIICEGRCKVLMLYKITSVMYMAFYSCFFIVSFYSAKMLEDMIMLNFTRNGDQWIMSPGNFPALIVITPYTIPINIQYKYVTIIMGLSIR